jgi:hypothetical protein
MERRYDAASPGPYAQAHIESAQFAEAAPRRPCNLNTYQLTEIHVNDAPVERFVTADQVTAGLLALSSEYGFSPVRPDEFADVRDMASRLMNHDVSTCETFQAVQALQPASSLCYREDGVITAIMGILLLREPAVAPLMAGAFDGVAVEPDLLSRGDETPAIGYAWGIAATTKAGGAAITAVGMPLRLGPLGELTFVTKAVTGAGRHVAITRFGYEPMRGPDDDMLVSRVENLRRAA